MMADEERGVSADADRATAAEPVVSALRDGIPDAETKLTIADSDKPLAFLELSDLALGRFARSYLIAIEKKVHESAGRREMPVDLAMSMHGAIALYRMAARANAGELHLTHEAVEWGGKQHGDWEVIVRRKPYGECVACVGCGGEFSDLLMDDNGETGCEACFSENGDGWCHAKAMEARSDETGTGSA